MNNCRWFWVLVADQWDVACVVGYDDRFENWYLVANENVFYRHSFAKIGPEIFPPKD